MHFLIISEDEDTILMNASLLYVCEEEHRSYPRVNTDTKCEHGKKTMPTHPEMTCIK